ncbi:chorismate mutase [Actinorhabdospora filicis]|uniref:chorismate mutase n=1 Tax=Actinorhabdospora filicis TaxID=1785913 RepID=A0A9W6SMJ3_9ACTN|nr:chorismate mutase [Actinorhabdospora filicis]
MRGAVRPDDDTPAAIGAATLELLTAVLDRNALSRESVISVFFTATPDLTADIPALAAAEAGWTAPMLCAAEMAVPGAMPRVIRLLAHVNWPGGRPVAHVYLRGTGPSRP